MSQVSIDVNVRNPRGNPRGNTKLHLAAENKNLSKVEELLSQGADVNAENNMRKTPLHLAALKNKDDSHFKVAEALLKNGADVNAKDDRQRTPIFYLANYGNSKIIQLFLNYKADLNVEDIEKETALFWTVRHDENVEVAQLLIDLGMDVDHRNYSGNTPLHSACYYRDDNMKIIKCLLINGADFNAIDVEKYTPLVLALHQFIRKPQDVSEFVDSSDINEDKLNFIMEHGDFSIIHEGGNFLSKKWIVHSDFSWKLILEHLAKLVVLNISVHPVLLNTISGKVPLNDYFEMCKKELMEAKSTKLTNTRVTFFSLLVDSRKKLKNYAGNEDLINNFNKYDCVKKFTTYGAVIDKNLKKGIKRRELFDKSADFLSDCWPIFNPDHLIIRDTLDCLLSKKYLSKFCKDK